MKSVKILIYILSTSYLLGGIFVAPNSDDSNIETIDQPLASIQKAQELASAGDTVFIRGGNYQITEEYISTIVQNLFACITYINIKTHAVA